MHWMRDTDTQHDMVTQGVSCPIVEFERSSLAGHDPASLQLDALQVRHRLLHGCHGRVPAPRSGSHDEPHLARGQGPQPQGNQHISQPLLATLLPTNAVTEAVHDFNQPGTQARRRLERRRQRKLRAQAGHRAGVSCHLLPGAVQLQGAGRGEVEGWAGAGGSMCSPEPSVQRATWTQFPHIQSPCPCKPTSAK